MADIFLKRPEPLRMLVAGDVMLDRYWFGEVNRISPEAPVPIVRVERREERLGGAANVARNATALGMQAGLLGVIGHDEAGNIVEHLLGQSGIASYLSRDQSISTIIKLRVIGRQQQLLRIDFEERLTEHVLRDKLTRLSRINDANVMVRDPTLRRHICSPRRFGTPVILYLFQGGTISG